MGSESMQADKDFVLVLASLCNFQIKIREHKQTQGTKWQQIPGDWIASIDVWRQRLVKDKVKALNLGSHIGRWGVNM